MDGSFIKEQSAGSMEHDVSSSRPTSQPTQDSSSWGTAAAAAEMGTFEFTSAPPNVSIPSFDPAIAAFADLSFTQPASEMPYSVGKSTMPDGQLGDLPGRDIHDKKRVKVESDTPALDSIDYWISFDDDLDKMGSFEIDYSKRSDLLGQNRPGMTSDSIPGLGSGLYSTSTAPFREEDFFDDSAFEQVISDDEEMFETTKPAEKSAQQNSTLFPQQLYDGNATLFDKAQGRDISQPGLRLTTTAKDMSRQMRRGICPQALESDIDEQRRFLEEALNSGRIPGALIPPNGFGIGFGAGMGSRPPEEFQNRPVSPGTKLPERRNKPRNSNANTTGTIISDVSDESESKKPSKRTTTAKAGASQKATAAGASAAAPKARSADRIAHNDVERKYRTNLKDKIAELRAAVPALHASGADGDSEGGSASGQQGGAKISKGTVLTKATEYIHQLEAKNRSIMQEHQQLARRLQAFETLLNSAGRQSDAIMPNHSMTLFDPRGFC